MKTLRSYLVNLFRPTALKKAVGFLHLWLGLISGAVVFVIAITGAIWVFEDEIQNILFSNYRTVVPAEKYLPPSALLLKTRSSFNENSAQSINYEGRDRPATLSHWSEKNGVEKHILVYANPYTGQVLEKQEGHSFFDIIIELHVNLLLGDIGYQIVDYATLIFFILLISGIVLWWPKNKAASKQRIWFRWKETTQWKRKNYDLHNILGFYASWVVVFIALTGLAWGFEWINKGIYYLANFSTEYKEWKRPISSSDSTIATMHNAEDLVFYKSIETYAKPFESIYLSFPEKSTEPITVYINPSSKTWYSNSSYYYDQRNLKALEEKHFATSNNGQKLRSMYYDIHIGKILGLPGQFLAFFACLIVASLPISGFYIWWGRKKNKNKPIAIPRRLMISKSQSIS